LNFIIGGNLLFMDKLVNNIFKIVLFIVVSVSLAYGQDDKALREADKLFEVRNYDEALPLYISIFEAGQANSDILYKIGKCYIESDNINARVRSIPFFEKAADSGIDPVPYNFYGDMGRAFFENEQLEKAINSLSKQKDLYTSRDRTQLKEVDDLIKQCYNALNYVKSPIDVNIIKLGSNINSEYTEYNPVVSADESVMAFTALRPNTGKTRSGDKFVEEIYISYNETGNWTLPEKVDVNTTGNLGTAGISTDGQKMMVFIGDRTSGSLYTIDRSAEGWTRPTSIGENVNSRYLETTASITPDGKTIYFASNRPGGYGGLDLYRSELQENGIWSRPVNLGPGINTEYDEEGPVIHPGQSMLFFSSNRPESIGGWDIFKTVYEDGKWVNPQNMGYPINTTANDNYFTLIADGSRGYFSSDRKGGSGGSDIYEMDMPENFGTIPLTMIKGRILDAETEKPLKTMIYMVDNETNTKLDFVYHPNPETGDYLIILPPDKNYDMIIESEGFHTYTLNIDVPNQTHFYELYQKIYLKTIKHFDVVVGQEIEVKNAFYNTHVDEKQTIRREHEATLIQNDSIDVYELMGELMEASDQAAIDYLLELVMLSNPIDEVDFDDEGNSKLQSAKRVYYYDESDSSKFEKKVIDNKEILSLPTMYVTKLAEQQKTKSKKSIKSYDPKLLSKSLKIYFDAGKSDFDTKYDTELNNLLGLLSKYNELGIEISGYASAEGDEEFNKMLSNKRATTVLNYLNTRGVVRRRIVAKGYGATSQDDSSKEEARRVEIKIIDLQEM